MSISSITSSPETENSPSLHQIIKPAVADWLEPGDRELGGFCGFGCFVVLRVLEDEEGKPESLQLQN